MGALSLTEIQHSLALGLKTKLLSAVKLLGGNQQVAFELRQLLDFS